MKKAFVTVVLLVAVAVLLLVGNAVFFAERADYGWRPEVSRPTFTIESPRVLFDEGHHNASHAGYTGRYGPLARLLRADGYAVDRSQDAFTTSSLQGVHVLVIANPAGAPTRRVLGIELPAPEDDPRRAPAFTASEIEVVRSWVEAGGSLLLIAGPAPFAEAAAPLASALGVGMHKAAVEIPGQPSEPLIFSFDNGRLGRHPILDGSHPEGTVSRVMTYTGQSLDGPPGATTLLLLPRAAVQARANGERPPGRAQGLAFEYGRGRVVVLGEDAMVTAQVSRRVRYGINVDDNDNQQFVLNVVAWLARAM